MNTPELVAALETIEAALFAGLPENAATRVILLIARLKAEEVECEHRWTPVSADRCEKCGAINTWID
jgi:hypothetical protein